MYAGDESEEDEVRRVRIEEREGRRGGEDEPFLWRSLVKFGSKVPWMRERGGGEGEVI